MRWVAGAVLVELFLERAVHSRRAQEVRRNLVRSTPSGTRMLTFAGFGGSGGGWGTGGGGGGGGFGGGGFGRSSRSDSKPGFASADGSRFREARINADKLNTHTPDEELDSEDEAMLAALGSKPTSMLPIGIYRKEHKDEGVVVATTAELEAAENAQNAPPASGEEESLWVDGDGEAPQIPIEKSEEGDVWGTDTKTPAIKKEPELDDKMDLGSGPKHDPEEKGKSLAKSETPVVKPKKSSPQDIEEKMIQSDLDLLASELGAVGIAEGEEGKTEAINNKEGRMYLFQFPPLLPPLQQISQPKPVNKVKPEPTDDDEANILESTPAAATTPVDLTLEDMLKNPELMRRDDDPETKNGFMSSLLSQGGMIGQLKVRKSGRVELDWGGRTLEMSPAAGMNFQTTAVIVEENDEKPKPGVVGGESIGMGKIMGRFVLAPTWDEEEEWVVTEDELRIPDDVMVDQA